MPATPIAATASQRCAISLGPCAWIHACNSAVKIGTTTVATNNALHIADSDRQDGARRQAVWVPSRPGDPAAGSQTVTTVPSGLLCTSISPL